MRSNGGVYLKCSLSLFLFRKRSRRVRLHLSPTSRYSADAEISARCATYTGGDRVSLYVREIAPRASSRMYERNKDRACVYGMRANHSLKSWVAYFVLVGRIRR